MDRHPPEEWRPGDPGDPMRGGPQPPGEPPHESPPYRGDAPQGSGYGRPPVEGSHPAFAPPPVPGGPYKAQGDPYLGSGHSGGPRPPGGPSSEGGSEKFHGDPYQSHGGPAAPGAQGPYGGPGGQDPFGYPPGQGPAQPSGGQPGWYPPGGHPTGGPPEPVRNSGELSEGPSGLDQAGYEHAGYAPGYGETNVPGMGAGSYAGSGPQPGYGSGGIYPPGPPGNYPPGTYAAGGYGYPPGGYTRPDPAPTPWGKILGIGCGVALLLMLVAGGCMALAMFTVSDTSPTAEEPTSEDPWPTDEPPIEGTDITAEDADFVPSPLYNGGEYTSVDVSVTNNSEEQVDVNPLYFTVVDDDGQNHSSRTGVGMDENEIGAETLSPGQATSGAVTVEGSLTPERVVFAPIGRQPLEVPVN
ncbi:DUF4352 domain-containing protein [Nocardiopsis coralli]|uniref:DUF4352 domain-containing protein n=1 Tax=Nocardiopsis coralli TaxID=2772213 RepID=UPI002E2D5C95|nr:DUF4352 domain-containing protein [Nocardiopsis coralli]